MTPLQHLLIKLGEEASEVTKEASKCVIFSPTLIKPGGKYTNIDLLFKELDGVNAVLELLSEQHGVSYKPNRDEIDRKKIDIMHYMDISRSLGQTDE